MFDVMLAGFDAADAEPPRAKKARTVLPDSDCETESDDDDSNTRSSDMDKYFTTKYDCDNIKPVQFWKCQSTKLSGLSAVVSSILSARMKLSDHSLRCEMHWTLITWTN